jgi:hypothetical protein
MLPFGKTQKPKIALQRRSVTRSQFNSRTGRVAKLPTLPPRSTTWRWSGSVMQLPKWLRLSEALRCVMETSVSEKQAKRDLCNALADGKIRLRFCFMWRPKAQDFLTGRDKPTTEVYNVKKSQIPAILRPSDFNWPRSQVRKPELWLIQGSGGSLFGFCVVLESVHHAAGDSSPYLERGGPSLAYEHRVELHSGDVLKVLCTADKIPDEQSGALRWPQPSGAMMVGMMGAIKQIWPDGRIPKELTAKHRNKLIMDQLERNGWSFPPNNPARTIQRALKKLREQKSK